MSGYDDATPEIQAATDKMIAEVEEVALDYARFAAILLGEDLDERSIMLLRTGASGGMAATIEWLRKNDLLKR